MVNPGSSHQDTAIPRTQVPSNGFRRPIEAQDFIEDFELPQEESAPTEERKRGDVPSGPDEKDKRLPPEVAQGD